MSKENIINPDTGEIIVQMDAAWDCYCRQCGGYVGFGVSVDNQPDANYRTACCAAKVYVMEL